MKKYFKINELVFAVDEGAVLFLRKLQALLLADNPSIMLAHGRDIFTRCVTEQGFAVSLKTFLDTASWSHESKKYVGGFTVANACSPCGASFERQLKWAELLSQFKNLDRSVCFTALILGKTADTVNNILKNNPDMDFQALENRIRLDFNEPDYLTMEENHYQLWVNLQASCGYTYMYDDMNLVECNDLKKIGMEEADDFGYNSLNCALLKGSETLLNLIKSTEGVPWGNLWESEEEFKKRVVNAYEQQKWLNIHVNSNGELEDISDDFSVISAIPDIPEINRSRYQCFNDFLIDFDDSDIESIYKPWDVVDDATLKAILNSNLSGAQAISEAHRIKRRASIQEENNTELGTSTELAPLNDSFNSEMDTSSPSVDNSILHGTETSASLEFLYDEAELGHFLLTCIEEFELLSQFTANGVCGFFMVITRFIYGLYRLNYFFLRARKVKIKRFMKWWRQN